MALLAPFETFWEREKTFRKSTPVLFGGERKKFRGRSLHRGSWQLETPPLEKEKGAEGNLQSSSSGKESISEKRGNKVEGNIAGLFALYLWTWNRRELRRDERGGGVGNAFLGGVFKGENWFSRGSR